MPLSQISDSVVRALQRVHRSTGVPLAFGGLVEGSDLRLEQFVGKTQGALDGVRINAGQGLGGKVVTVGRPLAVDDYFRTPGITHRYDLIIEHEGLRAMAAVPVIVGRKPVAVLYGALHTSDSIGSRILDNLASEARTVEHEIVAAQAMLAFNGRMSAESALRDRLGEVYAELRILARSVSDPAIADEIVRITESITDPSTAAADIAVASHLTARELDVLALVALGLSNAGIADRLGVRAVTVKSYVKDVMRKLNATTRLEAVVIARRSRLLP